MVFCEAYAHKSVGFFQLRAYLIYLLIWEQQFKVYKKNIAERQLPLSLGGLVLDDEIPHIISVRLADAEEKRLYYGDRDLQETGWYRVNPGRNGNAGGTDTSNGTAEGPCFGCWEISGVNFYEINIYHGEHRVTRR